MVKRKAKRRRIPPLQLHVGPWTYTVKIVRDLKNEKGEELMGRAYMDKMEVHIDAGIAVKARKHVLFHELRHLWGFHFPAPSNEEEECDFSSTIQAATIADLQVQKRAAAKVFGE